MGRTLCVLAPLTGLFGPVTGNQDVGSCYELNMGMVLGIIACDIILTLLIALSVFSFVSYKRRRGRSQKHRTSEHGKGSMHAASLKAQAVEPTESPYEELYGVQSDIYSDLRQYRK